ncbi:MAG: cytochrome b/b6 domain-containing protein [Rhodospirillaceae bacterium]|nr:cytochrome b/b6 domain-containing protein [Rhodospirillaceae bacterium]
MPGNGADTPDGARRLVRHALADRLLHWGMAISTLILLGTAFLPILGIEFAWVTIHWVSGIVLTVLVIVHTVRASFWQDLRSMWVDRADLRNTLQLARWNLRMSARPPGLPGKYSLAQKLIHHVFTVVGLAAIVTGGLMMVKIDTPWWERNPYWLGEDVFGMIYVIHDLAALALITLVMVHIYFALRPEKLHFTRSMFLGWITRREYNEHHDSARWAVDAE